MIVVVFHTVPESVGPPTSNVSILVDVHGIVEVTMLVPTATSRNWSFPSIPHPQYSKLPSVIVETHCGPEVTADGLSKP
jgi:hypothetical protein